MKPEIYMMYYLTLFLGVTPRELLDFCQHDKELYETLISCACDSFENTTYWEGSRIHFNYSHKLSEFLEEFVVR